ncbi:MAG TPA: biotin/lipoyl-containing protein [Kofleriaceae bacterium]|nr:biotin/lipoyl-containing protein [Kofleriaceae bacterium]
MSAKRIARCVREGDALCLLSPAVGVWRPAVMAGALVLPGQVIGAFEILGRVVAVHAPRDAAGIVIDGVFAKGPLSRPVGFGDPLLRLDPEASPAAVAVESPAAQQQAAGGLVFRAPSAGRFYRKSGPGKPVFVSPGQEIAAGTTVCLLEVMKTFTRITYEGDDLPARVRVIAIIPEDESDLAAGDPILTLEPLPADETS